MHALSSRLAVFWCCPVLPVYRIKNCVSETGVGQFSIVPVKFRRLPSPVGSIVGVWVAQRKGVDMKHFFELRNLALVVICIVLNLGIGLIVSKLKLPFYLDSIGTVLATALGGAWSGIICGLLSVFVGSIFSPTLWAYAGTMVVIAAYVSLVRPFGYLSKLMPTALFGFGLGIVCAIVSAPVTAYIWKGAPLPGTDAVTAFFSAKGMTLLVSVILGNLATDPMDKLITSLVAFAIVRRLPRGSLSNKRNPALKTAWR
jgi:energy-coupling factor transport system substrate-specific component